MGCQLGFSLQFCPCLSMFISLELSFSLHISQCCPFCPLSIQRSSKLSFYYCLQSSSLSLSNSVADYCSSLLKASFRMQKCQLYYQLYYQIYCQHLFIMSRQYLIFWVFVARKSVTDKQWYYYLDTYTMVHGRLQGNL